MALKNNPKAHEDTIFAQVLADGKIHVNVPEGTEGAVYREYETSDNKKGGKWEHVYTELSGFIQKITFKEGDYGMNLNIVVGEEGDEKPVTLSLAINSTYGEEFMKKLPNIDQKKLVVIAPFSFTNDKGKKVRGLVITQPNKKGEMEKVYSFYYDNEKKVNIEGYPVPPKPKGSKPISKLEWKKYFAVANDFLVEDLKERGLVVETE